jgi:RNA polymerase sigma factor (sigma-70 family)
MTRLITRAHGSNSVLDAELMDRWRSCVDPAAVDQLVRRHGRMVLGVCRRTLRDPNDADDAFQATFLVFLRKARSLARPGQVAGWLHGVALRVARKAREVGARRRHRETVMIEPAAPEPREDNRELCRLLDAEIDRLPEKYRLPIVLCELEERTLDEAARMLAWPKGTVAGRLSRGREMLRRRLSLRRAIGLPIFLFGIAGASAARAASLPETLVATTVAAASGRGAPAGRAAAIARAFLTHNRWRLGLLVALLLAVPGFGAVAWKVHDVAGEPEPPVQTSPAPSAGSGSTGCHPVP